MGILRSIDRWFAPYKYGDDVKVVSTVPTSSRNLSAKEMVNQRRLGIDITTEKNMLDDSKVVLLLENNEYDKAYYYHDRNHHQLAVKFKKGASFRYQFRSDTNRKRLDPIIYPQTHGEPFDKTHLIPIGYHATESDSRILVGWDSRQNRVDMQVFERAISKYNLRYDIIWFVDIELKEDETAIWTATVWNAQTHQKHKTAQFHDKHKFIWG